MSTVRPSGICPKGALVMVSTVALDFVVVDILAQPTRDSTPSPVANRQMERMILFMMVQLFFGHNRRLVRVCEENVYPAVPTGWAGFSGGGAGSRCSAAR